MICVESSFKSVHEIVKNITNVAPRYNFGVSHVYNLKNTLILKGFDFNKECIVIDLHSPILTLDLLYKDMSLSSILPCKISVYEEKNHTKIALNTVYQASANINPDFIEPLEKIKKTLIEIINEAK